MLCKVRNKLNCPFEVLYACKLCVGFLVIFRPFGQMIKPMLDSMQVTPEGGHHPFQQAAYNPPIGTSATGYSQPSQGATNIQSPTVQREQPASPLQKDLNLPTFSLEKATYNYNSSKSDIHSKISSENQKLLDEFCEYVSTKEPAWSPSPRHISSFGKLTQISREKRKKIIHVNEHSLNISRTLISTTLHTYTCTFFFQTM